MSVYNLGLYLFLSLIIGFYFFLILISIKRRVEERAPPIPPRARPMSFSQVIKDVVLPATSMGPKVTFSGVENPEAHLTAFHT